MSLSFSVSSFIKESQEVLYKAWLNSVEHARMTGGSAQITDELGAEFTCWDGYIGGRNLTLEPFHRIIQSWRTSEFEDVDPFSLIEVLFDAVGGGTKITIHHTNLPAHGTQYEEGWKEAYFTPMKTYFEEKS
jgi:activator of HSP90 ATPase